MISEATATLFGVAVIGLDTVTIVRAVSRDHGVERTLAWIFAILVLPGVGALAYLALASPSVPRTTSLKARSAEAARRAATAWPGDLPVASGAAETLFTLAHRVTGLPPTPGNEARLLAENELAFDRIERAIDGARERVWAEYYLVRSDETGHRFLELLTERASQGIEVRFIYDAVGSIGLDKGRLARLEAAGGKVAMFLPVNPLRRRWAVHLRNHRKLVVVDDAVVFTGGMNIGDEYAGRSRRGENQRFRDTHLEIRGPAAAGFAQIFAEDWSFATGTPPEPSAHARPTESPAELPGAALVGALPSGPDQDHNASWLLYLAAIGAARRRLFLTTPYFIPDEAIEAALVCAALRGVDVRVLVPEECDVWLAGRAARSYYRALLEAGTRIHHYLPSMLHAKTLLVDDDVCIVGSANADIRSFRLNFEIGALVSDPAFVTVVEHHFLHDLEQSRRVTLDEVQARPFRHRLVDSAARLGSPLL